MKENNKNIENLRKELPKYISELVTDLYLSKNTASRINARSILEKMGPNILPYLEKILIVDDNSLRLEIAKVIEFIANETSIPVFIKLLKDEDSGMRWIAAMGLIYIGRVCIIPLLKSILKNEDESYYLRLGAHHVFKSLFNSEEKIKFKALLNSLNNYMEIGLSTPVEAMNALNSFESKTCKRNYKTK